MLTTFFKLNANSLITMSIASRHFHQFCHPHWWVRPVPAFSKMLPQWNLKRQRVLSETIVGSIDAGICDDWFPHDVLAILHASFLSLLRHITSANRNILERAIGRKFLFSCNRPLKSSLNEVVPQLYI